MQAHDRGHVSDSCLKLPQFAPDSGLRARVLAAYERHWRRRRMWRIARMGGLAASVAAVALLLQAHWRSAGGPVSMALDTSPLALSQSLEQEWFEADATSLAPGSASRMRAIDAQLQAAYDRHADAAQLSALWTQRNAALRGLIRAARHDGAVASEPRATRI